MQKMESISRKDPPIQGRLPQEPVSSFTVAMGIDEFIPDRNGVGSPFMLS